MDDRELVQIVDQNGENVCLAMTDLTTKEIQKAIDILDVNGELGLSTEEKIEEYSEDIGKYFTRLFVDGVANVIIPD